MACNASGGQNHLAQHTLIVPDICMCVMDVKDIRLRGVKIIPFVVQEVTLSS